jgi:peptidyl-tRNA hydrolase, PTH1 family
MADYDGWVVVGLGNPGSSYDGTRHNLGYLVCDELARRMSGRWKAARTGRASVVEGRLAGVPGVRAVLGRARSYRNESGGPVAGLLSFYKVAPDRLVVVHDEIDLPFGDLRVKFGGGDNGHNGLKSIRRSLGTGDFYRVRLGVGRPPGRQDAAAYLLGHFSSTERRELDVQVQRAADAVESLVTEGLQRTQNLFNS